MSTKTRILLGLSIGVLLGAAVPLTAQQDATANMEACYEVHAAYYGGTSCQPPTAMVGAVFGSCTKEETAVRAVIKKEHNDDNEYADDVMSRIRAGLSNQIQTMLLDSQIKAGKCTAPN